MNSPVANGLELSASVILTCVQVALQLGINPALLESWVDKVQPNALETGRVDQEQITQLLELLKQATGRSDLAFLLGESYCFDFSPAVSMYLNSLDSIRTLQHDLPLIRSFFCHELDVFLEEKPDGIYFWFEINDNCQDKPEEALLRFALAGIMAFCQKEIQLRFGGSLPLSECHFRQPVPDNVQDYRNHLQAKLVFNSDFDGFILPQGALDISLKGALPVLVEKAREHMRSVIASAPPNISLSERILQTFSERRDLLSQPIQATAAHFNLSERTLQRRLQFESITFFELQEKSRQAIACNLLKSGHSTEHVADSLGFSDRRSFCRAFKRWFGMPPSQFKQDSRTLLERA